MGKTGVWAPEQQRTPPQVLVSCGNQEFLNSQEQKNVNLTGRKNLK